MKHSLLPPSSAARRMACPGSRALEQHFPQGDSPESLEGDAAHWLAAETIRQMKQPRALANVGDVAPNGIAITQEMLDGAVLYQKDVLKVFDSCANNLIGNPMLSNHTELQVEEKIGISRINENCWGTPDAWLFNPKAKVLNIWDYKFGHRFVEVFENWQLIEYAAGILEKLRVDDGVQDQYVHVNFIIVQPRSFHRDGPIRTWFVKASDLRPYFNRLEAAETAAMQELSVCTPNPECRDCKGRHACEALQNAALSAAELSSSNLPHNLPPAAVGTELRYLQHAEKLLKARISGLETEALEMIKRGERVPNFTVEPTKGMERWTKSADEIISLGELNDINLAKPAAVITPKQAIEAGLSKELVRKFSETPTGALKLVPESSKSVNKLFNTKG